MLQLERILHPTDFSAPANQALDHALLLADASGGRIDLLHVIEHPSITIPDDYPERAREVASTRLSKLQERATKGTITTHVRPADDRETPATCILEYADATDPALIVIGTHGRHGLGRWLIGSTAEKIVRRAQQPVYVVRGDSDDAPRPTAFEHILAPVDFSPASRQALDVATTWSQHFDAHLSMLHVLDAYPPPGIYGMDEATDPSWAQRVEDEVRDEVHEWREAIRRDAPHVESHLESGEAAAVIVDYADEHDVDLLILGSHGRTGMERFFLGSTTEKVVRSAPCPVLVVTSSPGDERPN